MGAGGIPTGCSLARPCGPGRWPGDAERPGEPGRRTHHRRTADNRRPELKPTDAIVADTSRAYGVVREDSRIEVNRFGEQAWTRDGVEVRVVARVNATIPAPADTARSLTVASGTTRSIRNVS